MTTIKARFEALDQRRQSLITRAEGYANLSIPSIMPQRGMSETSELPVPFAAATARMVTRLASRLTSTLVPLNDMPFFSLDLDEAEPVQGEDTSEEQKVMSRIERRIMRKLSTTNFRDVLYLTMQHLQVVGNGILQCNPNYTFTLHRLNNFVIRRRMDGEWHELIIRQFVDPSMLPAELKIESTEATDLSVPSSFADDPDNAVYTQVINNHEGGCDVKVEYKGRPVPSLSKTFPVCPYAPARWTLVEGENYARGLIEDNCGDIRSLEIASEALLDGLMAAAEWRFGVNPAGLTEIHDIQESENGSFVPAANGDVFPIVLQNQAQIAAMQAAKQMYEQTLGQTFLSVSSLQRQGERVTATEWKLQASELEQALGGVFGAQAREVLPVVVRYTMYRMLEDGLLIREDDETSAAFKAELERPDGIVGIRIRTGIEALNREVENEKMNGIIDRASRMPQAGQEALEWTGLMNRWLSTEGIEPTGLVKTVEQRKQEMAEAQQAQQQQAMAQQAIQSGGAIAEQQAQAQVQE